MFAGAAAERARRGSGFVNRVPTMRRTTAIVLFAVISAAWSGCATVDVELVTLSGAKITAPPVSVPEPEKEPEPPPAVQISDNKITIDEKIQFETWSAKLLEESHDILDQIAQVMIENGQLKRIEIQGHTARTGQSKRSFKLSVDRANAVKEYLVKKGVSASRLVAKGYGESKPVADNTSAGGREQNRRVEFLIVSANKGEVALAGQSEEAP
jgi:outer membrane protein OmpA-like peptidoglycan-associated protein